MLIFDFLRRFFGWADNPSRKRRAVSFTQEEDEEEEDVISRKRHKPCDVHPCQLYDVENGLIQIDDSSEDEIQVLSPPKLKYSNRQLHSSKSKMGCSGKRNETMLNKAHRLREKSQYEELLQKFLPHRIHVIQNKPVDRREVVEVIDLEDYEPRSSRPGKSESSVNLSKMKHKSNVKQLVINLNDEDDDDSSEVTIESIKCVRPPKASKDSSNSKQSLNESNIKVNSLRDQLSAKAVIQQDFIPRIAKRYNERVEQRYKEAEELKKMTTVLSKHNRLAREAALEEHLARSMRLYEAVLDETEEPEEVELPTLTETMLRQVKQALIPQPADQILVEGFGLRISRKDMYTLSNSNWLNDEVINFYMNLLIARGGKNNYPRVHAMNTFFYPKLISGGHSSLKRWTRKIDIFAQELIVVPIHLGIHWCMSIIDFRDKTIRYYDSMGGDNQKCLASLRNYLEAESLDKKGKPFDTRDWKLVNVKDIPQQMNGSDCGVFSCMFAEFICANRKITFAQEDMSYFRKKMVYEILNSKIL
ncbi:sentrin-specific protease 1-like [Ceratina calcarata]|uniref:Sentrin-specific protease 1-like n=1 Tax=Ceratina calcarata TaxID=156304 RepID=A0AAJ7S678_9HYME|nr:sentrin-specific protease 1-like [Ceratina calcarata]XP_017885787.1 sentrin-specific protease 1-like [Ceratina calcarata]XP_017885788.1 sentrin-specific protease 1-like [Ceratina calcarata]XP_017885790.1 sentrin-specific protease 1-like [Ceratina calcarata]XP_026672225.1 sentrin-specific protease 1-like [Ceratina calcarata]XP_026672226.1 sentrin-specific protease 1-like [Ceratina calcarata]